MKKFLLALLFSLIPAAVLASPDSKDKACSSTLRELLIKHQAKKTPKRVVSLAGEEGMKIRMLHDGVPRSFRFGAAYLGKNGREVEEGVMTELSHIFQTSFSYKEKPHQFNLVIPATMVNEVNMVLLDKMKHLLGNLSSRALKDVDEIALNPYPRGDDPFWKHVKSPKGQALPETLEDTVIGDATISPNGKTLLNLYPFAYTALPLEKFIFEVHHELGHLVAIRHFGEGDPGDEWAKAIDADGGFIISPDGKRSHAEDFAESLALYIYTDGGVRDAGTLEKFSHRFEILDRLMEIDREVKDELVSKILMQKMLMKNSGSQLVN